MLLFRNLPGLKCMQYTSWQKCCRACEWWDYVTNGWWRFNYGMWIEKPSSTLCTVFRLLHYYCIRKCLPWLIIIYSRVTYMACCGTKFRINHEFQKKYINIVPMWFTFARTFCCNFITRLNVNILNKKKK